MIFVVLNDKITLQIKKCNFAANAVIRRFYMEFLGKIIQFFGAEMVPPTNLGWFHLLFIALAITSTVLVCVFLKNANDKTFRIILFACWTVMVVFEIYKQLINTFEYNAEQNVITSDYTWRLFPFQLCSSRLLKPLTAIAP